MRNIRCSTVTTLWIVMQNKARHLAPEARTFFAVATFGINVAVAKSSLAFCANERGR